MLKLEDSLRQLEFADEEFENYAMQYFIITPSGDFELLHININFTNLIYERWFTAKTAYMIINEYIRRTTRYKDENLRAKLYDLFNETDYEEFKNMIDLIIRGEYF